MLKNTRIIIIIIMIFILNICLAKSIEINIAVAANFLITTQKICYFLDNKNIKKQELKYIKNERFLVISNPKLSPYGKSSKSLILNLKIKHKNIILGSNVNNTFNFIKNNTCNIGLTSFSNNIQNKINYNT